MYVANSMFSVLEAYCRLLRHYNNTRVMMMNSDLLTTVIYRTFKFGGDRETDHMKRYGKCSRSKLMVTRCQIGSLQSSSWMSGLRFASYWHARCWLTVELAPHLANRQTTTTWSSHPGRTLHPTRFASLICAQQHHRPLGYFPTSTP